MTPGGYISATGHAPPPRRGLARKSTSTSSGKQIMWHDIRQRLEIYDQVGASRMALAKAANRLTQSSTCGHAVAETVAGQLADGWRRMIPLSQRPDRP
jgi:hypothetical protein